MEFYAASKEGIIIYDALSIARDDVDGGGWRDWTAGQAADGLSLKVIATIPSPPSAFCHTWSADGSLLASVCDEGVRIYDVEQRFGQVAELPRVQPDVEGRVGGVRNLQFSPQNSYMVVYEKWEPGHDNVHVWDIRDRGSVKRLHDCLLKQYTSGALPADMVKWTHDEQTCLELLPGEGVRVQPGDYGEDDDMPVAVIRERGIANFNVSPKDPSGIHYIACYVPEMDGMVARVAVYSLGNLTKPTAQINLPPQTKGATVHWNFDASAVLVLASSDVDPTGESYFGTTYLYWLKTDGKGKSEVYSAKDGLVQDLSWSPMKNEFMVIVGMLPAKVRLHDGKTGKQVSELGTSRRNSITWNPFGRFVAIGGFGTLPGDMDFFDRSCEETVSSLRAPLTVTSSWAPDGRSFMSATVAPRMNEGNQISIYRYTGEKILQLDFKPEIVNARHEDTGAGARTKTQALLFAAGWRPGQESRYEDSPATPRPVGSKARKKGLPAGDASAKASAGAAWKPKGADSGSSLVAAMMRGEIAAPPAERWTSDKPTEAPKQLEEWEIKKLQREHKKAEEQRILDEKEKERQLIKDMEQNSKDAKKRLKELKQQLADLQLLKDKDWDELTDEDEAALAKEADLIAEIATLEKK